MAGNDLDVRIRISADGTAAVTGVNRVDAALDELNRRAGQAGGGVDGLTNSLLQLSLGEQIISAITAQMGEVAQMADDWNNLQARIGLVTGSAEEAAAALEGVRKVANATRTDVNATGDLYTTLARALKSLGDETTNVTDLTETIAQALALSGRGASENRSAIIQFSQALASGVLRGDEFNSMMENGPRLMKALADALGTTTGKLRAMAEEGKLTADLLVAAFKDQGSVIAAEFAQLPLTIGGAMTNLGNAVKGMIGDFDDTSASSTRVAEAIQGVAEHLDDLATIAAGAGLAAVAAGAVKAASAMQGLSAATLAARTARAEQAIAERTALATAADTAALNARVAASFAIRAESALAAARIELAAAEQAAIAARTTLANMAELMIFGERRAIAERELTAALTARAAAEERVAVATQISANATLSASAAAGAAASAQTAAAATSGIWARAATTLGGALGLLKSPMNALMAAATAIIGYQVGAQLRDWGLGALSAAKEGTLAANAFDLLATAAEKASFHLNEINQRTAEKIQAIAKETGLAVRDTDDFNNAVEKGALIWDTAEQAWRRGAVSLETARSAISKLDAALQTQATALDLVAKREEAVAQLAAQRRNQTLQMAKALGDEGTAMSLTAAAREADVAATERGLVQSKAALATTEARLANMIQEAQAGKGLTEQKQAEIVSLTAEVETKRQAVAASQLAVEAARIEQVQAQLAAETYGDQSKQLAALTRARTEAANRVADLQASHDSAARASSELATAEQALTEISTRYQDVLAQQAAGNQDLSGTIAELGAQHLAATAKVDGLKEVIADGAQADQEATQAKFALAQATVKVTDAARDLIARRQLEADAAERTTTAMTQEGALRVTHLRNLAREAEARGEITQAAAYQQQALDAEIEALARLEEAKQREIVTAQAVLDAKQKEVDLDGTRSFQEEEAIARAQEAVASKTREGQAIEEAMRAKEEEVAITREAAQANQDLATQTGTATQETKTYGDSIGDFNERMRDGVSVQRSWSESLQTAAAQVPGAVAALQGYEQAATDAYQAARTAHQAQYNFNLALAGVSTVAGTASLGMQRLNRQEVEAAITAASLARAYDTMQAKAADLRAEFDRGDLGLSAYASRLQALIGANRALGEEKLQPLRDALRDAREQMADFTDSARDGLRQLQIEWAQLNNNQAEAENLQYQRDRLELEGQITEAQQKGNTQAIAALQAQLALLAKIHAKKMADLKDEQKAAVNSDTVPAGATPTTSGGAAASMSGSRATATGGMSSSGMSAPVGSTSLTMNINVQGMVDASDRAAMTNLTRTIKPYFDDLTRRGL